ENQGGPNTDSDSPTARIRIRRTTESHLRFRALSPRGDDDGMPHATGALLGERQLQAENFCDCKSESFNLFVGAQIPKIPLTQFGIEVPIIELSVSLPLKCRRGDTLMGTAVRVCAAASTLLESTHFSVSHFPLICSRGEAE